jgi:peptide/nickel transport system ATP-binding protein
MRQRVVIAMALACKPKLLIADEPTTALDVTIQAQILELIKQLQSEMQMSVMLITHDLAVIAETCDRVVVMYAGRVVESATVHQLFDSPRHPYTRGLLDSIPKLDTVPKSRLSIIEGMVPGLLDLPPGCRFANRCTHAVDRCNETPPGIDEVADSHHVSCYRWGEL